MRNAAEVYMERVKSELDSKGIGYAETAFGIQYTTGVDKWIAAVYSVTGDVVTAILYHKNMFKCHYTQRGSIPDYHIQFKKPIGPYALVKYTTRHQKKFAFA